MGYLVTQGLKIFFESSSLSLVVKMTRTPPPFLDDSEINATDPSTKSARAARDSPEHSCYKHVIESLYNLYHPYIGDHPKQLRQQLMKDFDGTIWHLALFPMLESMGFKILKSPTDAPDVRAEKDGVTHWFEAINSNLGEFISPASGPEFGQPHDGRVLSRLIGSIKCKANRFEALLEKGVVKSDERKIIALTAHRNNRARRGIGGESFMKDLLFGDGVTTKKNKEGFQVLLPLGYFHEADSRTVDCVIYNTLDPILYLEELHRTVEWYWRP